MYNVFKHKYAHYKNQEPSNVRFASCMDTMNRYLISAVDQGTIWQKNMEKHNEMVPKKAK